MPSAGASGDVIAAENLLRRIDLLVERLKPISTQVAQVVYEAGPTGFALVRRLRAAELKAEVIAPSKIPTMPGPEAVS